MTNAEALATILEKMGGEPEPGDTNAKLLEKLAEVVEEAEPESDGES